MGKSLIIIGVILIILGLFITFGGKINFGKLPGDIIVKRENFTFYFPITTMILLSLILSLVFFIVNKLR
ncbi:MAG: DUF2905 domain-containing protein [Cyclobacteriaceae bacterium]|nr:DUF2905 domain-containing protein [Cyclobacteriaceae bacterium SS2]